MAVDQVFSTRETPSHAKNVTYNVTSGGRGVNAKAQYIVAYSKSANSLRKGVSVGNRSVLDGLRLRDGNYFK